MILFEEKETKLLYQVNSQTHQYLHTFIGGLEMTLTPGRTTPLPVCEEQDRNNVRTSQIKLKMHIGQGIDASSLSEYIF